MANVVDIIVHAKDLTGPAMASVNAKVDATGKGIKVLNKTAMLATAGFAAFGVEAVKSATKFDSEMTLLQTQAGVSGDKIDGLKKGVLSLAGKVGQDPDSLAESLYHVESNFESMGITSAKALKLTETAAKGATTGHANLVDVTNALTAAVAAGIPGVQNLDQAMGVLNATVGIGDMKMSDLAAAFGTGMVATVKGYGLSIRDVAAGLAVFGDNNIRGAKAGTQLRMTVQSLARPAAGGAAALQSIGLATDTLAKDMQKGGLKLALEDLVAHMKAAGLSSKQQGQIITEAFGKKAGTGLNILVDQMDRLESKYPALDEGAKNFAQSWEDTKKTMAFQFKQIQTGFEALAISIGEKLLPVVQASLHFISDHRQAATGSAEALLGLAAAAVAVSAALKLVAGVKLLWSGMTAGAKMAKSGLDSLALRMMYMRDASAAAGGGIKGLAAAFGTLSKGAKIGVAVAAIGALVLVFDKLSSSGKKAPDVDRMTTALGKLALTGRTAGTLTEAFGKNLDDLGKSVDRLAGKGSAMDHFNDTMNKVFTLGMGQSNSMKQAKADIDAVDKGLADLVSNGHADQAREALVRLGKAGVKIPHDKLDDYAAALDNVKLQSDLTAVSQGKFGKQAQGVQQALKAQQDVADGLRQSLQALDEVNQGAYGSETKFEQTIADATAGIKENGRTLNIHTDAGRKNRDLLLSLAAATDDVTGKLTAQKAPWSQVDSAYERGYEQLVKTAMGMGDTRSQAESLARSLIHLPKEVAVKADLSDLQAKLATEKRLLAHAPKSQRAKILGDIADLEKKIRSAKAQIAGVHGKTVTMTLKVGTAGMPKDVRDQFGFGADAHGGVVGAASGGPRSRLTLVGEQGPELVSLAAGSTVHSNPDSRRMLAGGVGGGGVSMQPLAITLMIGNATLGEVLVDPIRKAVRTRGGNVQAVLGVRGK